MKDYEEQEALKALVNHYGWKVLLKEIDVIIERIKGGVMSVTLDSDPQKNAMSLLEARYKAEGALHLKSALLHKVRELKGE